MTHNTPNFDNIDFIRFLNRIILEEAFKMMTEGLPCDNKIDPDSKKEVDKQNPPKWSADEKEKNAQHNIMTHRHRRMWGKDKPATDMLGDIAETELKLEKQRPSSVAQPQKPPPLSEREMELFRSFVESEERE